MSADVSAAEELLAQIRAMRLGEVRLMEVCGTHTVAIARAGIRQMLPRNVHLISGPGCPVCVTPPEAIDAFLQLSMRPEVITATYGDMIRVPGSVPGDTLQRRMAMGARAEVVYSPVDALDIAARNPDRQVVFLGVGFETTAPGTAAAVQLARARGLKNFTVFPLLRRVEPALRALLADPGFHVQGILCPGHVAVILGEAGFRFLPEEYHMPAVISGFEPEDILLSICRLLKQIEEKAPRLENTYTRAVSPEGNLLALEMMEKTLTVCDAAWRGLGRIPASAYTLRPEYDEFNAVRRFSSGEKPAGTPTLCRCGDILSGKLRPEECPLFGGVCTPDDPVGPCMVSSEGACAAAFLYPDVFLSENSDSL